MFPLYNRQQEAIIQMSSPRSAMPYLGCPSREPGQVGNEAALTGPFYAHNRMSQGLP